MSIMQRSSSCVEVKGQRPVMRNLYWEKAGLQYLCDLDVGFLGELWNQEVLSILLGVHLHVEVEPGDGGLGTQVPIQRLEEEEEGVGGLCILILLYVYQWQISVKIY